MPTQQKTNKSGNSKPQDKLPSRRGIRPGDKVINRSKRKQPAAKIKLGTDLLSAITAPKHSQAGATTMKIDMTPQERSKIILNAAGAELVKRAKRGDWPSEERKIACEYLKALLGNEVTQDVIDTLEAAVPTRVERNIHQIVATTLWFKRKLTTNLQFVAEKQAWFQAAYQVAQTRFPA